MAFSFIRIGKGAKVKGLKAHDNLIRGAGDFIHNDGELEDAELKRNLHILPQNITKVVTALRHPSTNDNQGWKIMIVGTLLMFILSIASMAIYDFYVKPSIGSTIEDKSQTERQ
ncbi:MAG: hypothetical protein EPO31_02150 [Gammaproteobacteria bacterium]|nr:MAG: hypothetical protein EPO31_02150 [Gammaproteobacteria bacterium]